MPSCYSASPMLHHLNFQNVTITWYRLSRSKVYLSHTLSTFLTSRTMACRYTLLTFLTQLNQERWCATYLSTFLTPLNQERSCTHTYIPRGYADHPEDEFSHHKITQTIRPLENYYYRRYLIFTFEGTCLKSIIAFLHADGPTRAKISVKINATQKLWHGGTILVRETYSTR